VYIWYQNLDASTGFYTIHDVAGPGGASLTTPTNNDCDACALCVYPGDPSGTRDDSPGHGAYTLTIDIRRPDDMGSGADASETITEPTVPGVLAGIGRLDASANDLADCYAVTLRAGQVLTTTYTGLASDPVASVRFDFSDGVEMHGADTPIDPVDRTATFSQSSSQDCSACVLCVSVDTPIASDYELSLAF
jgi:hypothetical protein